jgi:D-alanyl-D-alanine carboxypeptidase
MLGFVMMRHRFATVLLCCALPIAAQQSSGLNQKLSAKIQEMFQASGAPGVSVAVVEKGRLVYAQAFGDADISPERPANAGTRYAIGSISKQFTAAALLLLQEQGKLSLDDKVSKYFPQFTRAGEISIRQLLSHTSGYEDYAPQDYMIPEWAKPTTPMALLDRWAKKPLDFDPGTQWQYSNTNYVLAGEIFEKASGRRLLPFLSGKIFRPLGMSSAGDCLAATPADAAAYTRYAAGPPRPVAREGKGWYFGAAGLCMTPSDLARWDIAAFVQRKILPPRAYRQFTREVRLKNGDFTHYALGLQVGDLRGIPMLYHTGEVSGFLASNSVFPNRGAAVIVLSNEDGVDLIGPLSREIARLVLLPDQPPASDEELRQVRSILEGLGEGKIDRTLFTANANSYFSGTALEDYKTSLAALGGLKSVTRVSESPRGGMTHRNYRAEYGKKTVRLNVYLMPDGKYEQFLVVVGP